MMKCCQQAQLWRKAPGQRKDPRPSQGLGGYARQKRARLGFGTQGIRLGLGYESRAWRR